MYELVVKEREGYEVRPSKVVCVEQLRGGQSIQSIREILTRNPYFKVNPNPLTGERGRERDVDTYACVLIMIEYIICNITLYTLSV